MPYFRKTMASSLRQVGANQTTEGIESHLYKQSVGEPPFGLQSKADPFRGNACHFLASRVLFTIGYVNRSESNNDAACKRRNTIQRALLVVCISLTFHNSSSYDFDFRHCAYRLDTLKLNAYEIQ